MCFIGFCCAAGWRTSSPITAVELVSNQKTTAEPNIFNNRLYSTFSPYYVCSAYVVAFASRKCRCPASQFPSENVMRLPRLEHAGSGFQKQTIFGQYIFFVQGCSSRWERRMGPIRRLSHLTPTSCVARGPKGGPDAKVLIPGCSRDMQHHVTHINFWTF
jgi:hypothetical protein